MEVIKDYWAIIIAVVTAVIGLVAWAVRVEAMAAGNTAAIRRLEEQRREDREESKTARDELHEMMREVRADIKTLLRDAGHNNRSKS